MQHARMFNPSGKNSGMPASNNNNSINTRRQMLGKVDHKSSQDVKSGGGSGTMSSNQANLVVGQTLNTSSHSRSGIENTIVTGRRKDLSSIRSSSSNITSTSVLRSVVGGGGHVVRGPSQESSPRTNFPTERIPVTVWFHDTRSTSEDVVLECRLIPGIQEGDICELTPFQKAGEPKRRKLIFKAKDKNNDNSPESVDSMQGSEVSGNNNNINAALNTNPPIPSSGSSVGGSSTVPTTPVISPASTNNSGPGGGANNINASGNIGLPGPASGGSSNTTGLPLKSNFQVSLLSNPLQSLLDLPPRSLAHIQVVDPRSVEADTVEVFIKDVSLSRDSMWSFSLQLVGSCVYTDKRLSYLDSRCGVVKCIYKNGRRVFSGYIGEKTDVIFRSESSKLIFLVQLSREMWHFEETGEILFHKLVNTLFPKIFQKWRDKGTHHSITIVLFTSVDLTSVPWTSFGQGERPSTRRDFFRVVVDQVNIFHWDRIMANLRLEFANFKRDIMLKTSNGKFLMEGDSLPSVKGNLLEAINLGITIVTDRFKNTDLKHSLNSFVVVTPGTGLFDVDYNLMAETSRKMLSLDAGLDIVCLSQPPLHIVPLFRYKDPNKGGEVSHCVPNWCDISFFKDLALKTSQWIPRCKIYELQMMGVMENEVNDLEIERFQAIKGAKSVIEAMDVYDKDVFAPVVKPKEYAHSEISVTHPHQLSNLSQLISSKDIKEKELTNPKNNKHKLNEKKKEVTEDAKVKLKRSSSSLIPSFDFSSLSLMWKGTTNNRSTSAANSVDVSTTAMGTVTNTGSDSAALNTLYSLKNQDLDTTALQPPLQMLNSFLSPVVTNSSGTSTPKSKRSFTPIPIAKSSRDYLTQPRLIPKDEIFGPSELLGTSPKKEAIDQAMRKISNPDSKTFKSEAKDKAAELPSDLLWTVVANPSKEMHSDILAFLRLSRWNGVFPPNIKRRSVKWRSFQSPAALPIVTTVFPSSRELNSNYTFQIYDVLLSPDNDLHLETNMELFREMVQLRLLLGFQICWGDKVKEVEGDRKNGGNPEHLIKHLNSNGLVPFGSLIYLSYDDELHRINIDFNGNLNVQLYRRIESIIPTNPASSLGSVNYKIKPYDPLIRTRYADEYSISKIDAIKRTPQKYNWNQFDQLLAGFEEAMPEDQRSFHKMKFVVMPSEISKNAVYISNEKLSDEEIRLEGLRKLIAIIEKGKYRKGASLLAGRKLARKKEEILPEINFYTGNLYDFLVEQEDGNDFLNGSHNSRNNEGSSRFSRNDFTLNQLAQELQGQNGLNLVDRTWHFKVHPHCFLGNELVSWLIENFQEIDSREEGTEFGQELKVMGLFKHVESRHGLLDGHYFYEFEDDYIDKAYKSARSGGWFNRSRSSMNTLEQSTNNNDNGSIKSPVVEQSSRFGGELEKTSSIENANTERKSFHLSSSVQFNVDPLKKSFKPEIVTVHYDKVHNPEHCYHIRLQWLNTTAKFIDETITNWSRFCDRYGLKLVETPWDELCTIPEANPFHLFVDIRLELDPWTDPEFSESSILKENKFYFHLYLLSKSGFLLDNRLPNFLRKDDIDITYSWGKPVFKYAQYIHGTGTYIVELRDNGDLFLAPNNVHLTRQRTTAGATPDKDANLKLKTHDAQKVMLDFRRTCTDKNILRGIFSQALQDWTVRSSL